MNLRVFPEHFLKRMSPDDRKKIGQLTNQEALKRYQSGQEREFKKHACNLIWLRGGWLFEQPMNKKTRGRPGIPDILACYHGKFIAVELKATGNTLEPAQAQEIKWITLAGGAVCVAYCVDDLRKFLDHL
jgi:hypothetical protein